MLVFYWLDYRNACFLLARLLNSSTVSQTIWQCLKSKISSHQLNLRYFQSRFPRSNCQRYIQSKTSVLKPCEHEDLKNHQYWLQMWGRFKIAFFRSTFLETLILHIISSPLKIIEIRQSNNSSLVTAFRGAVKCLLKLWTRVTAIWLF